MTVSSAAWTSMNTSRTRWWRVTGSTRGWTATMPGTCFTLVCGGQEMWRGIDAIWISTVGHCSRNPNTHLADSSRPLSWSLARRFAIVWVPIMKFGLEKFSYIHTADTDGELLVLDTRASTRQSSSRTVELHPRKIASVHINPVNDVYLATASVDKTACVWDLRYDEMPRHTAPPLEQA
jgi:WD40 repeat protein